MWKASRCSVTFSLKVEEKDSAALLTISRICRYEYNESLFHSCNEKGKRPSAIKFCTEFWGHHTWLLTKQKIRGQVLIFHVWNFLSRMKIEWSLSCVFILENTKEKGPARYHERRVKNQRPEKSFWKSWWAHDYVLPVKKLGLGSLLNICPISLV